MKYWNDSQPSWATSMAPSDDNDDDEEDEEASDMSEWASENEEQPLHKPVFSSKADEKEWERKQRNREYRVAARREKRNRKADEKKQRKLNATILRRMTKNPEKYNKNLDRNRRREVELERRNIYKQAVTQAERLAAIHDPTGKMFNVGPVVMQEDGKVISVESLERRAKAQAEKEARLAAESIGETVQTAKMIDVKPALDGVNPARLQQIQVDGAASNKRLSNNQKKKLAMLEERPPPPKPVIPEGIELPEGEENWLALWDLGDDEIERRVVHEKKRKQNERKALREKQKAGKAERRAARDERRKVYREKKLEWKAIKEAEKIQKRKLERVEQEEAKRITIEVNIAERARAMEVCAELGFTLSNVEGVDEIKPKALGMKGQEVDFDILEIGDRPSELKIKDEKVAAQMKDKPRGNRVDLGRAPDESKTRLISTGDGTGPGGLDEDFVGFEFGGEQIEGQEFTGGLNYNHKLRRKLHRAIEAAQIKKELLVRAKAKEHCEAHGLQVPPELAVEYAPIKLTGRRILEDGTLETEKQERVRKRLELAEYNKAAKVLRSQAKAEAIEAGLRVFAELTGKKSTETGGNSPGKEAIPYTVETPVDDNATETKVSSKKRRRSSKDLDVKTEMKSQKPKKATDSDGFIMNETVDGADIAPKAKKHKKSKKTHSEGLVEVHSKDLASEHGKEISREHNDEDEAARKEKKRLKKERKIREAQETLDAFSKKGKEQGESSVKPVVQELNKDKKFMEEKPGSNGAGQWNPDALGGDAARRSKFLRLLGAGKVNGTDKTENGSAKKSFVDITTVENELERQFEAGVRMKHDGQSKRRGLGA